MPTRNRYEGIDPRIIQLGMFSPVIHSALTSYSFGDMTKDELLTQIILAQDEANGNQARQILNLWRGVSFPPSNYPTIVEDWLKTLPLRKPINLSLEDIRDNPRVKKFRETDSDIHFICGYASVSIEKSVLRKEKET